MTTTSLQVITDAYYLSNVVSQQFQSLTGYQANQGLRLLNQILADKTIQPGLVPFFEKYDFDLVTGQQDYFIPNLIDGQTFTYFVDQNRFPAWEIGRQDMFGTFLPNGANTLPTFWHFEVRLGGSTLSLMLPPDRDYPAQIYGKFSFQNVTINQNLELGMNGYYIGFLTFDLARRLAMTNSRPVSDDVQSEWQRYVDAITANTATIDFSYQKKSQFTSVLADEPQLATPIYTGWTSPGGGY